MSRIFAYLIIALFVCICISSLFFTLAHAEPQIELIDPEESTDPLVMKGFQIMQQTTKLAPEFAGDKITCNNCHFNGGNTSGGSSGGISLVGVFYEYPKKMNGQEISLEKRISLCFERSLNGKPVPAGDPIMQAIVAYLRWISAPVKGMKEKPWLGLKPLKTKNTPSAERGLVQYERHCALCHKSDGSGSYEEEGDTIPPLFGPSSFNDGAGMAQLDTFASFTFLNMPQGQPYLTEEQALDIAAYITQQNRPKMQY